MAVNDQFSEVRELWLLKLYRRAMIKLAARRIRIIMRKRREEAMSIHKEEMDNIQLRVKSPEFREGYNRGLREGKRRGLREGYLMKRSDDNYRKACPPPMP